MIQLLMTAALVILAAARVPVLLQKGTDTVFAAALYAGGAAVLTNPQVYVFVDSLLGGVNLARLVLQTNMVLGLWFLRKGLLKAVSPRATGSRFRAVPLYLALVLQVILFAAIGPTSTTTTWGDDHEHTLVGALLSVVGISFIAWCCGEIALVCMRYIPRMSGIFQPGFCMVGAGSGIASVTLAVMAFEILSRGVSWIPPVTWMTLQGYRILELISVALVGIGLTLTAVAGHRRRVRTARWEVEALAQIEPIRERALLTAGLYRTLESDPDAPVQDRLHRLLVEIWDAQLAAGASGSVITPEEHEFLLSVEDKLDLDQSAK